jgi:hypothetical protein
MANIVDSGEYTFGQAACEIHVERLPNSAGGPPVYRATAFVWEKDGRALRAVGDRSGKEFHTISSDQNATKSEMVAYLESRFGEMGDPPQRHRGSASVRPIKQPPLADDRSPTG